jgi:DHA2 family multidrug resistance protein-like MFS transporter
MSTRQVAPAQRAGRREWIGLAVLMLPGCVVTMDLTVLHLAVPRLSADLKPSPAELLWIVDIYGFLLAGSLLTMGTLGDRIGRRRLLLVGAGAFALASAVAATATSAAMLIAARAILGVAGATLAPSTLALIRNLFLDERQRTVAVGYWVASFTAGAALGPLVGGLLLQYAGWGAVFLMPIPVMLLLLIVGSRLLPEFRDPHAGRLDLASAALSIVAVLSGVYGLKLVAQDGPSGIAALAICAGTVLGALFIRRQRQLAHPLIDLHLFRVPTFSATVVTLTLNAAVMFAASFFTAQYLQLVLGLSPAQAGLWTVPGVVAVLFSSQLAPRLLRWGSANALMVGGSLVCAAGFGVLTQAPAGGLPVVVAGSVLAALGAGPIATLANAAIVGAAPPERAGAAAAISQSSVDLSGSLGMAVIGSVGVAVYRSAMAGVAPGGLAPEALETARGTLGGAVAVARDLPAPAGAVLLEAARGAFGDGYLTFAVISAVLMLFAAAVLTATVGRVARRAGTEPSTAGRWGPRPQREG